MNTTLDTAGAYYGAGRLDEAEALYGRVAADRPDDIRALYSLAVIEMRRGRRGAEVHAPGRWSRDARSALPCVAH